MCAGGPKAIPQGVLAARSSGTQQLPAAATCQGCGNNSPQQLVAVRLGPVAPLQAKAAALPAPVPTLTRMLLAKLGLCLLHGFASPCPGPPASMAPVLSAEVRRVSPPAPSSQPCNPAVGGPAKSQLVHEVDAMGGEIGKMADRCYLQRRVLNRSKGPAVWALRAQTDKQEYARSLRRVLEETPNLEIREVGGVGGGGGRRVWEGVRRVES